MPESLPILDELRADLSRAYRRAERRPRQWLIPAGGLAAAAAAVLIAVLVGGGVAPPQAAAEQALRQAATVAGETTVAVPADDQFLYLRTHTTTLVRGGSAKQPATNDLITRDRETWTSIERPGRETARTLAVRRLTGPGVPDSKVGDRSAEPIAALQHYGLGDRRLSRAQLLAYPTDPQVLYDRLRACDCTATDSREGETFNLIAEALSQAAPADLRAGLYRALALVPEVELIGPTRDSVGRPGIDVAFTDAGVRSELVFDPDTATVLATRQTVVSPVPTYPKPGTVIEDTTYMRRSVTDATDRP